MSDRPRRNDSSQIQNLLQPDEPPDKSLKMKQESSNPQPSSSSCSRSSSSAPPRDGGTVAYRGAEGGAERGAEGGAEEEAPAWSDEGASSCCRLEDLRQLPQCHSKLGELKFSRTHTVLIDVELFKRGRLAAQAGRDMWHSNFVKMPSSQLSVFMKTGFIKGATPVCRWQVIFKQLKNVSKKKSVSVDEVKEAIVNYNPKYKDQWSFDALSSFVDRVPKSENYFCALFPKIAALAMQLPEHVKKAIPLLQKGNSAAVTLSQVQISCLLANAFFCTFPHRNTSHSSAEYGSYPSINFNSLFGISSDRKTEKLRAIMHYFKVVTDEERKPKGLVTFERRCLKDTEMPNWRRCKETMPKLHVTSEGTIETEGTGMLQVDFASSWLGGGVLGSGLVQEEILFLINPELIVSRLFTEKLEDNECLIITGTQQFSCYSGFSDTFEWARPHEDCLKRDEWARLQRQILAIDALHFKHRREQYGMIKVTRELNKAYCGFKGKGPNEPDIATGKWGCGAFNGDPQLKAVIQLMAAAMAKRGLAFFTFGDEALRRGLQQTHHLLVTQEITVGKLYELLEDFCAVVHSSDSPVDLFDFIRNTFRSRKSLL